MSVFCMQKLELAPCKPCAVHKLPARLVRLLQEAQNSTITADCKRAVICRGSQGQIDGGKSTS